MDFQKMIDQVKSRPDAGQAGMILCHNGVVRETSADGRKISGLTVKVDQARLDQAVERHKQMPGIIEILVELAGERPLKVGDNIMALVVAGDVRGNVFAAMQSLLDEIKTVVVSKTETAADV